MRNRKFQKNNKKIKKYRCGFISSQNTLQKCCEREKIKIILPFHFYPTRDIKFQKNSKKIQKIKRYHYSFISSFFVGKVRERVKIKIIAPFRTIPSRHVIENSEKITKNSKIPLWIHLKPKLVGKGCERERIKIIISFCSYPTRNRKYQKNSRKIQKIKKYHCGFISSQNRLEKAEEERK